MFNGVVLMGLLPFTNTLFGVTPLFGNNVWLNLIAAAIAFYYGFVKSAAIEPSTAPMAQSTM